ncbi:nuclear transport factor 2 family protein [Kineosporia sp. R_H_3]|uniref:nuclear transport factor 2 family protein n=1 Tax=Kineosporia sp. R_H_3 TaxID=1961848 RepID=UPI000B4BFBE1|nr:nuclear transport factor 2 family protein [Kineosporia sp. R_H_3]
MTTSTSETSTDATGPSTAGDLGRTATVAAIYEAFGRGDVPTILSMLAEDVVWDGDWADNWGQREHLDHFAPRRGHAGVAEFLGVVGGFTVHEFRVLDLLESGSQVVAEVVVDLQAPGGGRFRDEELHRWRFGPDGNVVSMRHYVDTAKHLAAGRGEDTTRR